ncbi:MAG: hypothetical protein ABIM19_08815, partial [candidate division WOR-3 bacterium]
VDSVIVVPLTAVGSYENQDVVYVFKNGKAVRTPVKLGVVGEGVAEVKEGLSEGDQVITGPASVLVKIKDGTRVKVKKEPGKPSEEKKRGRPPVSSRGVRL